MRLKTMCLFLLAIFCMHIAPAQRNWINVNADYAPIPTGFQVFKTTDSLNGEPFVAFYAKASLLQRDFNFTVDTTFQRRLTPLSYFEKNDRPLLVVNTTFFSFATHQNLNLVVKDGKSLGYNMHNQALRGKDTGQYRHPLHGSLGINKNNKVDIAWVFSDTTDTYLRASQIAVPAYTDTEQDINFDQLSKNKRKHRFKKWKMKTAVGGGPVLVQNGLVQISNNEEYKFAGKAVDDKHPRTLMGYTANNELIIMVVQGRMPGIAMGASLTEAALLMQEIGCVEALNLDGGGSSCMLINGKETIIPSAKGEQRPVPAVFIIEHLAP